MDASVCIPGAGRLERLRQREQHGIASYLQDAVRTGRHETCQLTPEEHAEFLRFVNGDPLTKDFGGPVREWETAMHFWKRMGTKYGFDAKTVRPHPSGDTSRFLRVPTGQPSGLDIDATVTTEQTKELP